MEHIGKEAYRKGMEALLAGRVPNLISQNTVLEPAFLGEESSADGGLLDGLKFVGNLRLW